MLEKENSKMEATSASVKKQPEDVDEVYSEGFKLLLASALGQIETAKKMIEKNADLVNFEDYDQRTPLHVASSEGHLLFVRFLVEKCGAVTNRSDRWGGSALDDAHRQRHSEIVTYLREKGGKPGNSDRSTRLINAAAVGDIDEVKNLIKYGDVNLNQGDYDKRTALHLCATEGHVEILELLLDKGADVNVEDTWGGTPLDYAVDESHEQCVKMLEKYFGKKGVLREKVKQDNLREHEYSDRNMMVDISELEMIARIGSGSIGDVYKCRWRGTLVAAKCIKSSNITNMWDGIGTPPSPRSNDALMPDESDRDAVLREFRKEVTILRHLRHPNISMLLAYSTAKNCEVMVLELMKCSLEDILSAHNLNRTRLTEREQASYIYSFASGMNYLHTCNPALIHGDLIPLNLLIDYSGVLKIADFGLARFRAKTDSKDREEIIMSGGTTYYRYMAPEVFRSESLDLTSDVYSFSMISYYILSSRPPWEEKGDFEVARAASANGERPIIPRSWDMRLVTMLKRCWSEKPEDRPPFGAIVVGLRNYLQEEFHVNDDAIFTPQSEQKSGRCSCVIM